MSEVLSSSIQYIKGIGPKLAKVLSKKGIDTIEDALYFMPRGYEDRRQLTPIRNLVNGRTATLFGKVLAARTLRQGRRSRLEVTLSDGTGSVSLLWFNAFPQLVEEFAEGSQFLVYGEVRFFRQMPQIAHPEYEKVEALTEGKPRSTINFGRVVPVYSETEGLHQKTLRRMMGEVIRVSLPEMDDALPESLRTRLHLPSLRKSFVSVHFPEQTANLETPSQALRRIIFEEFFILQLGLGLNKREKKKEKSASLKDEKHFLANFEAGLGFPLTQDQKRTIEEVKEDLAKNESMVRLVQGDVGAGKTVVAFAGAAIAASAGFQTALMAPTELLAQQHFKNAEKYLGRLGIKVLLVTHATSSQKSVRQAIQSGEVDCLIGTHALFQEGIKFKSLGLVIVDEQHRFGVDQRKELIKKATGYVPHLLMMTATPIPRTLALTLYGDLDLSLIRQKPPGRTPVKTTVIRDRDRPRLYQKIRERVERGEQVYIIYPLIEKSEKLELKSATEMFDKISKEVFPGFSVALLHGRMKPEEKDSILIQFKEKKFQILVSTTVIEVGIDVANATLMVIEHPERLGLSQLHQLRGRVGRGSLQSECVLVSQDFVTERLKIMTQTEDGFEIAEEDLRIRGPGEFLGTRQSGLPGFRVGHLLRDADLLQIAKVEAELLLADDPELQKEENKKIRKLVETRWKEKLDRVRTG